MQVWLIQYLIRDFKESDSAIIDAHDPEVFKLRLVQNDGWDPDAKHARFAPFATICFHVITKRYLEQTSSHLIGKLLCRLSYVFRQTCEEPAEMDQRRLQLGSPPVDSVGYELL